MEYNPDEFFGRLVVATTIICVLGYWIRVYINRQEYRRKSTFYILYEFLGFSTGAFMFGWVLLMAGVLIAPFYLLAIAIDKLRFRQ